jgi:hypothetical protein
MLQSLLAMSSTGQHAAGALAPGTAATTPNMLVASSLSSEGSSNDVPHAAGPLLHQGLQLASPTAMIMRGYGSEMEHSIFLCGIILLSQLVSTFCTNLKQP